MSYAIRAIGAGIIIAISTSAMPAHATTAKAGIRVASAPLQFRAGVDEDNLACARRRESGEMLGVGCVSDLLAQVCADDRDTALPRLAHYLRTAPQNVAKALARSNLITNESRQSVCDVEGRGEHLFIAYANRPKKPSSTGSQRAESNRDHMQRHAIGNADAGAFARAIEQRAALVAATRDDPSALAGLPGPIAADDETGTTASGLKTAGLPASAAGWTNLTGYEHPAGRVNDLLIDGGGTPTTRTMWAGTDGGGIWKTTDGGTTWNAIDDKLGSLVIGRIVRSPLSAQVMYASTNPFGAHSYGPYGIVKSTDGGATWNQLAQTNPNINGDFLYVTHLAIHPTGAGGQDVLLAATNNNVFSGIINQYGGGVYQSTDSGATWTKVSANIAGTFVAFHPTDGQRRAYSLMNGQFFVTSNGTLPAVATSSIVTGVSRSNIKFAWSQSDVSVLLAIAQNSGGATTLWRSTSGGASWSAAPLPNNPYPIAYGILFYTGAVWIDPTNPLRVAVAEGGAASTPNITTATNDHATWSLPGVYWTDFHGIIHDPGYNGTSNKIVYMMDDGGLYRYDNVDALGAFPGSNVLSTGMTISEVYSVAGRGGNVIFGAQDVSPRAYRTDPPFDALNKWRLIDGSQFGFWIGDGAATAASRANPAVLYGSRQYLDLFRSSDGGVNGVSICGIAPTNINEGRCGGNSNAPFIARILLDPSNSDTLYAGAASLWRTQNATAVSPAWAKVHSVAGSSVDVISVAPSSSQTMIVGFGNNLGGTTLHRSLNATAAVPVFTPLAATGLPGNVSVNTVMFDRTNASNIWAGTAGSGLYFSNNGGVSFTLVAGGFPATTVFSLAQHPSNAAFIYAGTLVGLFASANAGSNWGASNEGPATALVRDVNWFSESGTTATMLIATFGRGIWRTTIDGVAPTPILTVVRAGSGAGSVSSPAGITCGGDCTETYGGPTPVTLTAQANANNVFTGWLGACNGTSVTCNLNVAANTTVTATFAPGTSVPKVDVDANAPTKYDALTDGLMILRYLFNLNAVVNGAIGPNATRTTDVAVLQHLTDIKPLLDVDGNGQADALTDGLLLLRYMFGLRGSTLIANAVGAGATRTTAAQIEGYLALILQ